MSPDDLGQQIARLTERMEGMRLAVDRADEANEQRLKESEDRIRADIDRFDRRVNGRITKTETAVRHLEKEIYSEKVFLARVQGAAEERERHGLPPDPLPPPVPSGTQPTPEAAPVSRMTQNIVAIVGALAVLLGGIGALAPLLR